MHIHRHILFSSILILAAFSWAACAESEENNNKNNTDMTSDMTTDMTSDMTTDMTSDMTTDMTSDMTTDMTLEDPDPTCDNYCDTVMAHCKDAQSQYTDRAECIDYCENIGAWETGTKTATEGNTIACRIYHGNRPAQADPATHCVHAGPTGGNICGDWCTNYCHVAMNMCTDANSIYANDAECLAACANFATDGNITDTAGDTVQCRITHAKLAKNEPAKHCPHVAEDGGGVCGPPLDPEPTCDNYCDTVIANCTGDNNLYSSKAVCMDFCENIGAWDAGSRGAKNGNSIACRIYHGNRPAQADPATHCVHAGFTGGNICGDWCTNYCDLSFKNCVDGNAHGYTDMAACTNTCANFSQNGNAGDTQYDTVQCRIYHLGAAKADPMTHCPHAAESPSAICLGAETDFIFDKANPSAYTRVDRMGMPAVSTAFITNKDAYNDANPADDVDANNPFVNEIVTALDTVHAALDDDLTAAMLTPCTGGAAGTCVAQGSPLIIPDTIKIDTTKPAGFPNGRRLQDQAMDITFAVILLDLSAHMVDQFSKMPLNPPKNDLGLEGSFLSTFPYLHPPHTP